MKFIRSRSSGLGWGLGVIAVASAVVVVVLLRRPATSVGPSTNATPAEVVSSTTNTPAVPTADRLVGRWVRPDGGYIIEIHGARVDGRLDAAYLNPRPIHVARAESRRETDGLHVFIELRDVNYPGATYKLRYAPESDRLAGEYFQPMYNQTFEVEFVRAPE
jgi:hypothetical protein